MKYYCLKRLIFYPHFVTHFPYFVFPQRRKAPSVFFAKMTLLRQFSIKNAFFFHKTHFCSLQRVVVACNGLLQLATVYCSLQRFIVACNGSLQLATVHCKLQ
jgi:hypothetical protein